MTTITISANVHAVEFQETTTQQVGTTLVAMCHPAGMVLVADTAVHDLDGSLGKPRSKVFAINARVIGGIAGLLSVDSLNPSYNVDIPKVLKELERDPVWLDPKPRLDFIYKVVTSEAAKIPASTFIKPHGAISPLGISIMIAGYGNTYSYLIYLHAFLSYVGTRDETRLEVSPWTIDFYENATGTGKLLLGTTKPELQKESMEVLLMKRPCPVKYTHLKSYLDMPAGPDFLNIDLSVLEAAAIDAVKYTSDRDTTIGTDVAIKAVKPLEK